MLILKVVILLLVGILNLFVGILILTRNIKKVNNIGFFGLSASMAGWIIGIAGFLFSKSYKISFFWAKIYYLFPLVIAFFLVIFCKTFPDKKISKLLLLILFLGFLALALPLELTKGFITSSLLYHDWGKQIVLNIKEYIFYGAYIIIGFIYSLFLIYKKSKSLPGLYAIQSLFFFVGFSIAATLGLTFNLFLPGIGNYQLIWLGPIFSGVFILFVSYSIIKHRMFDIRLAIVRSFSYISSIVLLSFLYGFVVFTISKIVFRINYNLTVQIVLSLATGFAGLFFYRIRRIFDKVSNRIFYQDAYEPQELFDKLNRILVSNIELNKLIRYSSRLLSDTFKSKFTFISLIDKKTSSIKLLEMGDITIQGDIVDVINKISIGTRKKVIVTDYLESDHDYLKSELIKNNISVVTKLNSENRRSHETLGYIFMGSKKSGNQYNNLDIKILDTISKELILAIQNALNYEEIKNFNVVLQQRIEDATRKLRKSNEKLKALDESKDDFISMASHQLRTPLTSVKGYMSIVLDEDVGKINEMQRKMLNQAFFSAQRMVYLIADLLNVSRLKTGKFVIEPKTVNLANMIEEEMIQLLETAKSKDLTLTYEKPKNFPNTVIDETKTRQVIMNYIDNAVYYTPKGGKIEVILTNSSDTIEFKVVDNGIGVPKNEQHHLFTKFYRANNARKVRPDGTGLGLFMAKKVIVAEGGVVLFDSQENKGSTFGFMFAKNKVLAEQKS